MSWVVIKILSWINQSINQSQSAVYKIVIQQAGPQDTNGTAKDPRRISNNYIHPSYWMLFPFYQAIRTGIPDEFYELFRKTQKSCQGIIKFGETFRETFIMVSWASVSSEHQRRSWCGSCGNHWRDLSSTPWQWRYRQNLILGAY